MAGERRIAGWLAAGLVLAGVLGAQGQDLEIRGRVTASNNTVYTMNSDGTDKTTLAVAGAYPDWSPDGTKI
ncbi:MAG: hypothetical protein HUU16_14300, partial [Candidatus Omnitrophica bacterium]|nr:hypothetical protein [Candidatus Omnitrophota bacterium]